jgi:hypothetical protein
MKAMSAIMDSGGSIGVRQVCAMAHQSSRFSEFSRMAIAGMRCC